MIAQLALIPENDTTDVACYNTTGLLWPNGVRIPIDHPVLQLALAPSDQWPGFVAWCDMLDAVATEIASEQEQRCNP